MSISNVLDQSEAICARTSADLTQGSPVSATCGTTLHVGFFFDGFGRNLEADLKEDRVSNIGRLFLVHPYDKDIRSSAPFNYMQKFYLSGLGTSFDPSLGGTASLINPGLLGAVSKAQDGLMGIPKDIAIEQTIEGAKDWLDAVRDWWERPIKNLTSIKLSASGLVSVGVSSSAEGWGDIRDFELMAKYLKTGVDTRLEAAFQTLNDTLDAFRENSEVPLKRIAVSVYGFDFGATLARAFSHKLFAECEPGTSLYQGIKLDLVFAGLFDAVDRSMASSVVLDYLLPLANRVDDGECLPGLTKAALHLVAAHECRDDLRARLIGTSVSTPRWEERLVPGISQDVGGGLLKTDIASSRELSLACLHEMYRAAYRAGVPFPELESLPNKAVVTAKLFVLNDHIGGISAIDASTRYMQKVGARKPSAEGFLEHRRWYIRHLRGLWDMYSQQYGAMVEEERRLERPVMGSSGSIARYLGLGDETPAQAAKRDKTLEKVRGRNEAYRKSLGWLEEVDEEARFLKRGYNTDATDALLDEWFNPNPAPLSADIEDVLEYFLNDRYMVQTLPTNKGAIKYFNVRRYDTPDWRKTEGFQLNQLQQTMG